MESHTSLLSLGRGAGLAFLLVAGLGRLSAYGQTNCTHDIECDDGLPCTVDQCDFPPGGPAGSGTCAHTPVPDGQPGGMFGPDCVSQYGLACGGCDDGLFCNGAEVCQGGACAAATPPCTGGEVCSESMDVCQPGPCSEQKSCIGGTTPGAACTANANCGNGGRCGFADCDDGVLCNGNESCIAGSCNASENPCGFGAPCGERQCSLAHNQGWGTVVCTADEDCPPGAGECTLLGPVCLLGRCCSNHAEPNCSVRFLRGFCSGSTPGTNAGAACMSSNECNVGFCAGGANSCTGQARRFYPDDHYFECSGCAMTCGLDDHGVEIQCPKYSGGIAPHGDVLQLVGPVSNSPIPNPHAGTALNKLGDDYAFSNIGTCVGGTRNGLGCADETACNGGGVCDLDQLSVMSISYVRFLGGILSDTQFLVDFRDEAGRRVASRYPQWETVFGVERLFFDPPLIVPSRGFVIFRVPTAYTANGGFVWAATEAVDTGGNNPDVLWLNDGPVANFLSPNPGVLAFELEGEKVAAPRGACCESSGNGCTDDVLPWVCQHDGNTFLGAGSICPARVHGMGVSGSVERSLLDEDCARICTPPMGPSCEPYFQRFTRFIAIGCNLFHPCLEPTPVVAAIRVELTSLHHVEPPYNGAPSIPFSAFEGQARWVGPPTQYAESSVSSPSFWVSRLQCTPHYRDWNTIPVVLVTGPEIVPSSVYQYQLLYEPCQGSEETCPDVSPLISIATTRWGDVEVPYNPPDGTTQPDVGDISALVNKFRGAAGAPTKVRGLLAGTDQFGNVNLNVDLDFTHIAACVDAFRGLAYPYTMQLCP